MREVQWDEDLYLVVGTRSITYSWRLQKYGFYMSINEMDLPCLVVDRVHCWP